MSWWRSNWPIVQKHFKSEKGRHHLMIFGNAVACSIFTLNFSSQTFLIHKYRDLVQLYKNGFPTPVSPEVMKMGGEVLEEFKFSQRLKSYVEYFSFNGLDLFYLGSIKTRQGAYIGVPENFTYRTTDDIDKSQIIVDTKPVPWGSDGGQLLQESLILSDDAKKFGIARQLAYFSTYHIYLFSTVHGLPVILFTMISQQANTSFYGLYKPLSFRIFVYTCIATFLFGVWSVSKDMLTKHYERKADQIASSLGPNYAKGGIEFYEKALQKNKALRLLMKDGQSRFTIFGNENEILRQKHVPLTIRKDNVEKVYKKFTTSKSEPESSNGESVASL